MDGNTDIREQVMLMRAVIGRKIIEMDEFSEKAASSTGEESEKYLDLIDVLKNDIAGYKTIIEDFKDGTNDLTGNVWDIASFPEGSAELYHEIYLPSLSAQDRDEETEAMNFKCKYAEDLARAYLIHLGRQALTDPRAIDVLLGYEDIVNAIGAMVLETPEVFEIIDKPSE